MKSTFKILFYLKRDKQKSNGQIPLFCRITVDGGEARFGMKCDINPKYWDVKTGKATGRTTEATQINSLVDTTRAGIYKVYREMQERENYVTAEKIKNVFLGIAQKHQTLLELFDFHNDERKLHVGINLTKATYNTYCFVRQQMADFLLYKYNLQDIPVKEINKQFIEDFELYLTAHRDYSKNTLTGLMKKFRHVIEVAINKEWIYKNPFKNYSLSWQKTNRGFLTQEEIEKLIYYPFKDEFLEKARDIFVFCCFTGLSYTDVKNLTIDNIQSSVEGKLWIKGKRKKTDTDYDVPLLEIPKNIINKYKEKAQGTLLLPVVSVSAYNKKLKKMAIECGIDKRMSSHLARHSFATLALTEGVSIESVSKMLGHTNIKTTQIYAKITDKKIGNEMTIFAGNVKQMETKLRPIIKNEVKVDELLRLLKIAKDMIEDRVWETLINKTWDKMSNVKRQNFASVSESKKNELKTMQDFYLLLMDYFLENLNEQNNHSLFQKELNKNDNKTFAINF